MEIQKVEIVKFPLWFKLFILGISLIVMGIIAVGIFILITIGSILGGL